MPIVGTNPAALNAAYYLNVANAGLNKSIMRLSSGSKLVDPSDDAAGVAVSSRFDASTKRLAAAAEGTQDLVSFVQTADGFLKVIQDQLVRMSELASRATNGAFSASDRANYSLEFEKLTTNITNQITNARFNGAPLFDTNQPGSAASIASTVSTVVSQDGANIYTITLRNLNDDMNPLVAGGATGSLFGLGAMDIRSVTGASAAIGQLTTLLAHVATDRANVNSDVSALNFYTQDIGTEKVNVEAANSRIKDLEFAEESTQLAKYNILTQAGTAMLAQANTSQQSVLGLLR
jgi:flagellin